MQNLTTLGRKVRVGERKKERNNAVIVATMFVFS
jgi:hypothetical protein